MSRSWDMDNRKEALLALEMQVISRQRPSLEDHLYSTSHSLLKISVAIQ